MIQPGRGFFYLKKIFHILKDEAGSFLSIIEIFSMIEVFHRRLCGKQVVLFIEGGDRFLRFGYDLVSGRYCYVQR